MILGKIIERRIKEIGITKAEFARRIDTTRQNVNGIIRKESMDTSLLAKIGKVLKHDFFQYIDRPYKDDLRNRRRVLLIVDVPEGDDLPDLNK